MTRLEVGAMLGDIITAVILLVVSVLLFMASIRSFLEKGYLFNNAYIYASKKERETMNKKPYYRQTAVIFFLMGMIFLLLGIAILLNAFWFTYITGLVILVMLVYAVVSSIAIEKEKRKK